MNAVISRFIVQYPHALQLFQVLVALAVGDMKYPCVLIGGEKFVMHKGCEGKLLFFSQLE